jgi:hypothetical protein
VIIYDDVLGELRPSRWTRLASLSLSGPRITPAQETVQFYSSDASNVAALRDRLQAFGRTLPPGIKFVID